MLPRLIAALVASASVILASPLMGQIRAALRAAFPRRFVAIVGGAIAAAVTLGVALAVSRIRDRRPARYAALLLALSLGIGYSLAFKTGVAEVDTVERVHFVEYGLIALLFYRVWRDAGDPSSFVLPLLAGAIVGTLDEWLQWFVPVRVGEARDVLLDVVGVVCGLLFAGAIAPPAAFTMRLKPRSLSTIGLMAASTLLIFAGFLNSVHIGNMLEDSRVGLFKSRYSVEQLEALSRDREARWRTDPPVVLKRFSREDQYMDEGFWHIRRRNESWAGGDYAKAWHENLILERFFAPVLDTSSYATPRGARWPPEQRADAEARVTGASARFVSDAEPLPILVWPRTLFWSLTVAVALAIAAASLFAERKWAARPGR
ncbi:MAG TPA: VanZ family protein [Vicinamibacterales bacterium]|nr:VanZ family protein [Vicinamibacterales bacterium]